MTRKQLIEYRDEIAIRLIDMYRIMRMSNTLPAAAGGGAMLLCNLHEAFARQLDQSYFEPVNTLAEETIIDAIRLLQLWNAGSFNPPTEVAQVVDRLKRILPRESAKEQGPGDASGK